MSFNLIKPLRRWLFPQSKLVEEGTRKVDAVIKSIRHETDGINQKSTQLKQPDALWRLTKDMQSVGRYR